MSTVAPQIHSAHPHAHIDADGIRRFVGQLWDEQIVGQLMDYIRIPNQSPAFDPNWAQAGHMDRAMDLIEAWVARQPIPGMHHEVVRLDGRTPLLIIEIPGALDDTVVLYGHMDKQPEMTGWDADLGPWQPVLKGDKLYGRGGADDGYAVFGSLGAIMALQAQGIPHARCVVLIEGCEESGSYDLPYYVDHLAERIGQPSLVVCLDSGCGNYDQLWLTTSLRGLVGGTLSVEVLSEGVHSGDASGVVPSSFRLTRQLLSRIEDEHTGRVKLDALYAPIPDQRRAQATLAAAILGDEIHGKFPFLPGMAPMNPELTELVLNRTWRPALSITGAEGLPPLSAAGNVLRPRTALKLSLRLPPTLEPTAAAAALKAELERDPPNGAKVRFEIDGAATGWNAPALSAWLEHAVDVASRRCFGHPVAYMGEGGTIPFMGMLGAKFPDAQFLITGVLGPHSNAHGPNEFLHIPTGKRVTEVVAHIVADHFEASSAGLTRRAAHVAGATGFDTKSCC
jgi:acetylornithine deacetylase/succinyl-diaminopimelate desuccinylase-like protein